MLNELRNVIRFFGETVKSVVTIGGVGESTKAEYVRSDTNRMGVHFAFGIGADSQRLAVSDTTANITFSAGVGRILRVLSTVDCSIRIDQPAAVPAIFDPNTNNVEVFLPLGETVFLLVPDTAQDAVLSAIADTGETGDLYASIIG
jgi:hypothetical protein